jgi:hypothetical protein
MDGRYKPIHQFGDGFEVRRQVVANVNGLFAETTAELGYVRDGNVVQGPEGVLVKGGEALFQPNLNAVCQQVVLPEKIFFLHKIVKLPIIAF